MAEPESDPEYEDCCIYSLCVFLGNESEWLFFREDDMEVGKSCLCYGAYGEKNQVTVGLHWSIWSANKLQIIKTISEPSED